MTTEEPIAALPSITQQPIVHVDATPDNNYPLRILKAYRTNCDMKWAETTDIAATITNPLLLAMNEHQEQRAKILDDAILCLEDNIDRYTYEPPFPPGSIVKSNPGLFVLTTGHFPDTKWGFTGVVIFNQGGQHYNAGQTSKTWATSEFELSSLEDLVKVKSEVSR